MIESLVTKDQSRIDFLKALAKSFARENSSGDRIMKEPWSADYVIGKGSGLIFLLHGKPGVGKTYTAGKPFILIYKRLHTKATTRALNCTDTTNKNALPSTPSDH